MCEEIHTSLSQSLKELTRGNLAVLKALEFTHCPGQESLITYLYREYRAEGV